MTLSVRPLAGPERYLRWQGQLEVLVHLTVPGGFHEAVVTREVSALQGYVAVPGGDMPGFSAGQQRESPG